LAVSSAIGFAGVVSGAIGAGSGAAAHPPRAQARTTKSVDFIITELLIGEVAGFDAPASGSVYGRGVSTQSAC
jgi:hypothetical protein